MLGAFIRRSYYVCDILRTLMMGGILINIVRTDEALRAET